MKTKKISELLEAGSVNLNDVMPINQDGQTKKASVQSIAGSLSDTLINSAIEIHNNSSDTHPDIRQDVQNVDNRVDAADTEILLLKKIEAIELQGALLTRSIDGKTNVGKNLFASNAMFIPFKTFVNDPAGTLGVYIKDINSGVVEIKTLTVSPAGHETVQHPNVPTNADLPLTVLDAVSLGWDTPVIGDYTTVDTDETMGGLPVEWYIILIDDLQNITWGNPRVLNLGDYQQATPSSSAGKVLTGGDTPGTWGEPIPIDLEPAENSNNLVRSGGVAAKLDRASLYTYVVDSDAKLKQWADNAPGNDYSRVLVRAGTWTYNDVGIDEVTLRIIDMSTGRTKSVNGEAGSKIVFNSDVNYANFWVTLFYGDNNVVINDLLVDVNINVGFNDNFFLTGFERCQVKNNVNININCYFAPGNASDTLDINGIVGASRITNCDCRVNISGNERYGSTTASAFVGCSLLYSCVGSGHNGAFRNCRTGFGCRGVGNTRAFVNCYMEQVSGNTAWANTAAGGYNYNLTA